MDQAIKKIGLLSHISPRLDTKRKVVVLTLLLILILLVFSQACLPGSPSDVDFSSAKAATQRYVQHYTNKYMPQLVGSQNNELHADDQDKRAGDIPNFIHFVHFQLEHEETFDLRFREWVAIYSAHYYMNPDAIYIHSNIPSAQIDKLVKKSFSPWTQAMMNIPEIQFHYLKDRESTSNNVTVDHVAHKTDFARLEVLIKHGGIYLDDDCYILRPLHQFRHMGFENVMGLQGHDKLCPSAIFSVPNSRFISVFRELMDTEFDGSWDGHSVELMTRLAIEFSDQPYNLISLPRETFFPGSWDEEDLVVMYQVHSPDESAGPASGNAPVSNTTNFIQNWRWDPPEETWHHDWRLSYILHGWNHCAQDRRDQLFGIYKDISFGYVVSRRSNFARAVFPAVRHAWNNGHLDHLKIEGADDDLIPDDGDIPDNGV